MPPWDARTTTTSACDAVGQASALPEPQNVAVTVVAGVAAAEAGGHKRSRSVDETRNVAKDPDAKHRALLHRRNLIAADATPPVSAAETTTTAAAEESAAEFVMDLTATQLAFVSAMDSVMDSTAASTMESTTERAAAVIPTAAQQEQAQDTTILRQAAGQPTNIVPHIVPHIVPSAQETPIAQELQERHLREIARRQQVCDNKRVEPSEVSAFFSEHELCGASPSVVLHTLQLKVQADLAKSKGTPMHDQHIVDAFQIALAQELPNMTLTDATADDKRARFGLDQVRCYLQAGKLRTSKEIYKFLFAVRRFPLGPWACAERDRLPTSNKYQLPTLPELEHLPNQLDATILDFIEAAKQIGCENSSGEYDNVFFHRDAVRHVAMLLQP